MLIAPDFFGYMSAMSYLLSTDTSVYCVSAYNDNGQPEFVLDPSRAELISSL